jgi:hypothetical protein
MYTSAGASPGPSGGGFLVLKPTDFKNDQVLYGAFCRGGASLYEHSDYDMAASAANCILSMGFGDLDPVALDKAVTGKVVRSHPAIGLRSETITGACSPRDLLSCCRLSCLTIQIRGRVRGKFCVEPGECPGVYIKKYPALENAGPLDPRGHGRRPLRATKVSLKCF